MQSPERSAPISDLIEKLVSGGQTGVDRAALDVALALGIACGGWCPRGRRAEDGAIAALYPLRETPRAAYVQRTRWNVRDSDATLIVTRGTPVGGTLTTLRHAQSLRKPCRIVDLDRTTDPDLVRRWIMENGIRILNLAGPRESTIPGIYSDAHIFLRALLAGPGA